MISEQRDPEVLDTPKLRVEHEADIIRAYSVLRQLGRRFVSGTRFLPLPSVPSPPSVRIVLVYLSYTARLIHLTPPWIEISLISGHRAPYLTPFARFLQLRSICLQDVRRKVLSLRGHPFSRRRDCSRAPLRFPATRPLLSFLCSLRTVSTSSAFPPADLFKPTSR